MITVTNEQKKFWAVTDELMNKVYDGEITVDEACDACPYLKKCGEERLYCGCGVWEYSMGEDL